MKPPKPKRISSFRLASLLRLQEDPKLALHLFQHPNSNPNPKPFRYSLLCYDLMITKLGRAKMFHEMEQILLQFKTQTRLVAKEPLFCNIITFYGRAGLPQNALKMFDEMPLYRCQRTIKSYNTLLNVLMICKEFDVMREHFVNIKRHVKPDGCTFNIMIRGLCSDGRVDDALKVLDEMKNRDLVPNQVTFGTLIYGLCLNLKLKEAFKLKDYMVNVHGLCPNEYVYATLIKGLCAVGELSFALRLKEEMERDGVKVDSAIYSTLISGLFKVGRKDEVFGVLMEMELKGCKADTVTYNVMINGFCKDKDFETAYKILDEMMENRCKPDVISYNVILGELCKDGKWSEASDLFEDMPRRGCAPDVVSYRIVFDGLSDAMEFKDAAFILDEMVFKGFAPRSSSICKFINRLCQNGDEDLVWSVLNCLGKINAIDTELWKMAIAVALKNSMLSSPKYQEQQKFFENCLATL
ncbi:putative pentatricopeptide repeat-containing protein At1g53330 [Ricinus communis]|nr:putative pentatricopeptide repeat-containing protein At1g53330 [Ricinus communis]|eukprot:XP_015580969.1 putative pentatricopeptide repeat-containing protein At1g53330 [Ricinus communis]